MPVRSDMVLKPVLWRLVSRVYGAQDNEIVVYL